MKALLLALFLPAAAFADPAQDRAVAKYPELGKEGSPLHRRFLELYRSHKTAESALLANPNWPTLIADQAFEQLNPRPAPEPEPPAAAPGEAKIDGAFGKSLGAVFNPADAINKTSMADGTPLYEFLPAKAFRSFEKYWVAITPSTHKIFMVWAAGKAESKEVAEKEQALLMELLSQKYGPDKGMGTEPINAMRLALIGVKAIQKEGRSVMTKVAGHSPVTIEVRYEDEGLTKLAEKERLAIEGKKVDSSGL